MFLSFPRQAAKQELTPETAMRACNNPVIRWNTQCRPIVKLVNEHTIHKAKYAQRRSNKYQNRNGVQEAEERMQQTEF